MLSRLRMSVTEILEEFQNLLDCFWSEALTRVSRLRSLVLRARYKYNYKVVEREIKDMISRKVPDANADTIFRQRNDNTSRW